MATVTASSIKEIIADVAAKVQAEYDEKSKNWPEGMGSAPEKVMGMIQEQVTLLLTGDFSVVAQALVADVTALVKTGKSKVADAVSKADIA